MGLLLIGIVLRKCLVRGSTKPLVLPPVNTPELKETLKKSRTVTALYEIGRHTQGCAAALLSRESNRSGLKPSRARTNDATSL